MIIQIVKDAVSHRALDPIRCNQQRYFWNTELRPQAALNKNWLTWNTPCSDHEGIFLKKFQHLKRWFWLKKARTLIHHLVLGSERNYFPYLKTTTSHSFLARSGKFHWVLNTKKNLLLIDWKRENLIGTLIGESPKTSNPTPPGPI